MRGGLLLLALPFLACAGAGACAIGVVPPAPERTLARRSPIVPLEELDLLKDDAGRGAEERLALFDSLVAEVRAVHQFSPNTWENLAPLTFVSAVASLRYSFASAATEPELLGALTRFGNSLHDAHGGFEPAPPFQTHITLPVLLAPDWAGDQMSIVVSESHARGIDPGDLVTSYAGTPADSFLRSYADRSSANQWHGIAWGIAAWMTERPADGGDGTDGGTVTLGLHKRDGTDSFANLTWSRGGWHGENVTDVDTPQLDHARCAPRLPGRNYPTYELKSHGDTFCVYVSKSPRYAPYPVVRFFTFDFGRPFDAEAAYDHLSQTLRGLATPRTPMRGLVLDLRDNPGGNDPNWVLDWFAPKPYLDLKTQVRKTAWIDTIVLEDVANLDDGWVDALVKAPSGSMVSRFLGCKTSDCSDSRQKPQHRIVPVPVALLVGPRCNSACDHFARVWEENGLGPIVGEPTGAALTVLRLDDPVMLGGKKLGSMRLAISLDYSPFTALPVEGLPLHVDVPIVWTWEKRDTYDASLVDAAIGVLAPSKPPR